MAARKLPLTPEQVKQIETMAGLGLKVEQMASILGMSKKTFERRIKDTLGASDALEKGRAIAAHQVTKTAYELAKSGKVPAMTMFWLKCRERWRETQVVEHSGVDGKPIEHRDLSTVPDDQLDAKIQKLLEKSKLAKEKDNGS